VSFEPFTEQEPFLYDTHRYYGYFSGVGSGKTAVGVMRDALNMEYWNPGHMGAIVAPTTQMIKNAILPLMREFGLMERWEYKGPQAEIPGIQSPNGSRAVILSADNDRQVERLASLNLAWFHIDESRDVPPRARQILIQRLRKGDYTNGYFTSTPRGKNHDYQFFVGEQDAQKQRHGEATVYTTDDRLAITAVPTDANPHLDRDDVQAIRDAHPSGLLQQEVEGKFVEIGAGIFTREMLHFVRPDDLPNRDLNYQLAVDVGVEADTMKANQNDSDYWAITALATDPLSPQAYVIDCHRKRGMSLKQGVGWIKSVAASMPPNVPIYVESVQAQRWLQQELADQGLRAIPVNNTDKKEDRLIQLSIPLERGTVKFLNKPPGNATQQEFEEWKRFYENNGYAPRWDDMIQELMSFPDGSHDDLIDSLEIAVDNADIGGAAQSFMGGDYNKRAESEW
jgi:phage terminase large subunit-like protein